MELRITVLCENYVSIHYGAVGEHGFSAFVETPTGNFLFDTGQGRGIINNSLLLKKDLKSIKFLVISHGHYDHTLGIPQVLMKKSPLKIIAHPDIFANRFRVSKNNSPKFIGIPYKREFLERLGAKFEFYKEFKEIDKNIFITGEVSRDSNFEMLEPDMKIKLENGLFQQDYIKDDLSIVVKTSKGLVILLGCAHAGLINILNYAIEKTGEKEIYAVIGGTHLGAAKEEHLKKTINLIEKYNIKKFGASHCTGLKVCIKLANLLKDRFFYASVGTFLEV